jgi:GUN4-like
VVGKLGIGPIGRVVNGSPFYPVPMNLPKPDDATLGTNPGPDAAAQSAVLGGLPGFERGIVHSSTAQRIKLLTQALERYGDQSLGVVARSLQDGSEPVRQVARTLLLQNEREFPELAAQLACQNWQTADQLTTDIMLTVMGRQASGFLRPEDIAAFPCDLLHRLDWLWLSASQARFGFSEQELLWWHVRSADYSDQSSWYRYGERLGWYRDDYWKALGELTYSLTAPLGHLPSAIAFTDFEVQGRLDHWKIGGQKMTALVSRLSTCNVP